jgi:pyruvate formate lyase activating enzyme
MAFLASRKGLLDGVVISGGEPTLYPDIALLCRSAKGMGYPVKLDTNGSRPRELKRLIEEGLVDYVAMDIKTDPFRYGPLIQEDMDPAKILASIAIIMESPLPYEFRTTCVRPIVDEKGMERIARLIAGARLYVLQRMRCGTAVLDPEFFQGSGRPWEDRELEGLKAIAAPWVANCVVR